MNLQSKGQWLHQSTNKKIKVKAIDLIDEQSKI